MFSALKNHPFAVEAFFEQSYVLSFAVPLADVQNLIPGCFTADHFNNEWGFIAVAIVSTKNLKPKGFPFLRGQDFILAGYRVFVRYQNKAGKNKRGLFILKSETNMKSMVLMGNIFTHYGYTHTDIAIKNENEKVTIQSAKSGIDISINKTIDPVPLPASSPFSTWKEARRFAGPLPFTFNYDEKNSTVLSVEGVRQHWEPRPIQVEHYKIDFIDQLPFKNKQLANAFVVEQVPYSWSKGKFE